ncbi:MAG TPA: threonine synthase [Bacteroidales bacterium]|nr:threonine synthase [Bacteroidales bacterium]
MKEKFHYCCCNCGAEYPGNKVIYLCPVCSGQNQPGQPKKGVLSAVYNYKEIKETYRNSLFGKLEEQNFLPLLPINGCASLPKLKIGNTPLYHIEHFDGEELPFDLLLKDDSQNPTFSFKDRASALVSAWAKENGIGTIITASTGNAGSSLAGICAAQGQKSVIFVPATAPLAKLTQIVMYGATIVPVDGTYDDAFSLSIKVTEAFGVYNRNTAYNPLTIEGKKTVAFELFSQLNYMAPDRIFVPVGDGVIISGVYKGFEDLLLLEVIDHMPVMVAVQSEGSSNLIRNLGNREFRSVPSSTFADSISVNIPANFHMTAGYMGQYKGEAVIVTDDEILDASVSLAHSTGIFAEPAAAAAFAGMLKYRSEKRIPEGSKNVVLLTGSGLKDLKSVQPVIRLPEPVKPEISSLEKIFTK